MDSGPTDKEVHESEDRLRETEDRWDEVLKAQQRIDKFIERALRGGTA